MTDYSLPEGFKIPRPGSRKNDVWCEFRRSGREAAISRAKQLQIKDSSVYKWLSDWQMAERGQLPAWMCKSGRQAAVSQVAPADRTMSADPQAAIAVQDRAQSAFTFEYQLRDFLAANLSTIEIVGRRLSLFIDATGRSGVEYPTSTGPIDILCVDKDGAMFVFELKRARSPDSAIGQLARYMGWVKENIGKGKDVYGVIVAQSITDKLKFATSMMSNVFLFEYQIPIVLNQKLL